MINLSDFFPLPMSLSENAQQSLNGRRLNKRMKFCRIQHTRSHRGRVARAEDGLETLQFAQASCLFRLEFFVARTHVVAHDWIVTVVEDSQILKSHAHILWT